MKRKDFADLFTVDLEYSSLKDYLGDIVKTINEQGRTIETLQNQISKTVTNDMVNI